MHIHRQISNESQWYIRRAQIIFCIVCNQLPAAPWIIEHQSFRRFSGKRRLPTRFGLVCSVVHVMFCPTFHHVRCCQMKDPSRFHQHLPALQRVDCRTILRIVVALFETALAPQRMSQSAPPM